MKDVNIRRWAAALVTAVTLTAPGVVVAQGPGSISDKPGGARMGGRQDHSLEREERSTRDHQREMQNEMNRAGAEQRGRGGRGE